jgi:protein-disulfide isomerase|tara:strand:+ start:457 stop:1077 length:621 start_codon:yes stop_codon:yes gene_type:complete
MRLYIPLFFLVLFFNITSYSIRAEISLNNLIFDDTKPYHLKILDAIPKEAKIQIGPDNAKNTIIEFFDYFCGYCKKIHPELIELVESRSDVRVIFLQHPILNESSRVIAKIAIAANFQNKGYEFHNALFSIEGSITSEKLQNSIKKIGLNEAKLAIDVDRDEIDNLIKLSSFLAGGSGARGTPSIFINDNFYPGYLPKAKIKGLLK